MAPGKTLGGVGGETVSVQRRPEVSWESGDKASRASAGSGILPLRARALAGIGAVVAALLLPGGVHALLGTPEWPTRALVLLVAIVGGVWWLLWASLSPRSRAFAVRRGKLARSEFTTARRRAEFIGRGFGALLGATLCLVLVVPLARDVWDLVATRAPVRVVGTVVSVDEPLWGLWFVRQGVLVRTQNGDFEHLNGVLFWTLIAHTGDQVGLLVLPRSALIVGRLDDGGT